ncbi:hypothetical protein A0H81_12156 [Grifola frondosa]|uniref:Uncharacterized protein n=1 Tax=Grifola frondosa TaxID=5627 RepID=A0A1C7LUM1_GRIFR|nr:hypothetical protein A0H81_12156 [Grifola frondosa]
MTEYDYSPDAVERFRTKMAGVSDWVVDQKYQAPRYSNPFVDPHDMLPSSSAQHTRETSLRRTERPPPSRSRTMPTAPFAAAPAPRHVPYNGHTPPGAAYPHQPTRAQTVPPKHAPPPGYRTKTYEYPYRPGQEVVLPPPRPGETYVIIPPKGGHVNVIRDPAAPSRSSSRTSRSSSRTSPTKKQHENLLKRLLTNVTPVRLDRQNSTSSPRRERRRSS